VAKESDRQDNETLSMIKQLTQREILDVALPEQSPDLHVREFILTPRTITPSFQPNSILNSFATSHDGSRDTSLRTN